jgi:hypothetical protein
MCIFITDKFVLHVVSDKIDIGGIADHYCLKEILSCLWGDFLGIVKKIQTTVFNTKLLIHSCTIIIYIVYHLFL